MPHNTYLSACHTDKSFKAQSVLDIQYHSTVSLALKAMKI